MIHASFFLDNDGRQFVLVSENPRPHLGPNNWLWKYVLGSEKLDPDIKFTEYLKKHFGDVFPTDRMVTVDDNKPYYVIGQLLS